MDEVTNYRAIVEQVLGDYAALLNSLKRATQAELVFDREHDRYLLLNIGWRNTRRVHNVVLHLDIINGKIWIQEDHTEDGIAGALEDAGVTKSHIVLGFKSAFLRQFTEYAAA